MLPGLDDAKIPEIQQQAIAWLVRLRADHLSEDDMSEFAAWLAEDCLHSEAFAHAEDLFDEMVRAASTTVAAPVNVVAGGSRDRANVVTMQKTLSSPLNHQSGKSAVFRKSRMPLALAVAAVWLFAVTLVMSESTHPLDRLLSDYYTETGELREIRLTDGSSMLLNTNSAVSIDYDDAKRRITLHHGQALFTVAKDSLRPFEVKVDDLNVTALGTVFEVYRPDADDISVIVQQHAVSINVQADEANGRLQAVNVHEGQRLRYRHNGTLSQAESVGLEQATAWQQHRLLINDRPLGELIAELNRYRVGRIFLSDAQLNNLRVTGIFSLDNPDNIVRTVSEVLGLQETRLGPLWVLLHR